MWAMSEMIAPTGGAITPDESGVLGDLARFEATVRAELERVGLPSQDVFVDVHERAMMVSNVSGVLAPLAPAIRDRSHYISKMIAAATVGLFDAALNYLWTNSSTSFANGSRASTSAIFSTSRSEPASCASL